MIRVLVLAALAVALTYQSRAAAITLSQLGDIMPYATLVKKKGYLPYLNHFMARYRINTPLRQAHFLAQVAHESASLRSIVENLNYSESALLSVFGKYFTKEMAKSYARKPEKIANRVYANRLGNGNEASGDGWKYRGRGLIQLTGKSNYKAYTQHYRREDLVLHPEKVATSTYLATDVAGWFWKRNGLNALADRDDVRAVTKKINGGDKGLKDRIAYLKRAKKALGVIS